jgi:hypothetical protein
MASVYCLNAVREERAAFLFGPSICIANCPVRAVSSPNSQ